MSAPSSILSKVFGAGATAFEMNTPLRAAILLGFLYLEENDTEWIPLGWTDGENERFTEEDVTFLLTKGYADLSRDAKAWRPREIALPAYEAWKGRHVVKNMENVEKYLALSRDVTNPKLVLKKRLAAGQAADVLYQRMTKMQHIMAYTLARERGQETHNAIEVESWEKRKEYM